MKQPEKKEAKLSDLAISREVEESGFPLENFSVETGHLFYKAIIKIHNDPDLEIQQKCKLLFNLLNKLFVQLTKKEQLQFNSLFARIAYAGHKFDLPKQLQFYIHLFRKRGNGGSSKKTNDDYGLGLKAISETINHVFKTTTPDKILIALPSSKQIRSRPAEVKSFKAKARVIALQDDAENERLLVRDEAVDHTEVWVQYNIADRNEPFNKSIALIKEIFGFPVTLNLLDIEIDSQGHYRPQGIVIEPDYLIDVSTIAECFKDFGSIAELVLLKKFLPFQTSVPLMIGNIANYFLDELMTNIDSSFKELFPNVFRLNPLAFLVFENMEVRKIMNLSQKHFVNLKKVIQSDFPNYKIEAEDCFLEPSFYSEKYGVQGRLDIFYHDEKNHRDAAIVELKSGKAFKPNIHGLSANHYVQTLLYDLMIKSVFQGKLNTKNFILYSGHDIDHLKFAPVVKARQMEAIELRNQLLGIEWQLMHLDRENLDDENVFNKLETIAGPLFKGFLKRDADHFGKVYSSLSQLERKYFLSFTAFIAREHQLAKTGIHGKDTANGLAALWRDSLDSKLNNYDIISHLKLSENHSKETDPILVFHKTESTQQLANFRNGDIAVLYPYRANTEGALHEQIFKCTIIEINSEIVSVRLRSKQFNSNIFEQKLFWNLEHDLLDSGFTAMYRNLFQFAQFSTAKKELLLCTRPPEQGYLRPAYASEEMTSEQQSIFRNIISAEEYFLLWGPPGTGKTSVMLKHLVQHLMENTRENILLLAYTNRAVDEICEAIESIGPGMRKEYLRIGSRYSTAQNFQDQLLSSKMSAVKTRAELKEVLDNHRICVSTVASINSKPELLKIKQFHRAIIDEASQILEPMLVGLLPKFKSFVLIGDHKQLPAVVVQSNELSSIKDGDLQNIGLGNMRNSLFERMYKKCIDENWDWAYAQLSCQGRMHEDIMAFPNKHFYKNSLKILPKTTKRHQLQSQKLSYQLPEDKSELEQKLVSNRVLFFKTDIDLESRNGKTNQYEADEIIRILKAYFRIYEASGKPLKKDSIGIITPYRAQIAKIIQQLEAEQIANENLTIDTVERYQGGARDIILISLCTNDYAQMDSMVSLSDDGIDRKLNVALTRAREQVIILGNKNILEGHAIYRPLIDHCQGNGQIYLPS